MSTPTVVCVLGMHRSGTSAATRVLHALGAYLGPDDRMVAPAPDNPRGFWELRSVVEINDEVLARLGGDAMALPAFPPGWEAAPELEDLRARARALMVETFAGRAMWAWKDPRSCLTLAFWQRLLPPISYVLCVRDPAAVAASLQRRGGMPPQRAVHLWAAYTRSALAHSAGRPRCVVSYDGFLEDLPGELGRVAAFLAVPERAERPEVRAALAGFLDGELRHHRAAEPAAQGSAALQLAQRACRALERDGADDAQAPRLLQAALDAAPPWAVRRRAAHLRPVTSPRNERDLMDPSERKIFGIGLSKTGTSSLSEALNLLGISSLHYPDDDVTFAELARGEYRLSILRHYQSLSDTPVAPFYAQLDRAWPGSRFVLTVREKGPWLESAEAHWKRLEETGPRAHDARFRTFTDFVNTANYGCIHFNAEHFSYAYDLHVRNVHDYFADRPDDLLVLDICREQGWEELCAFLGVPVPKGTLFPHPDRDHVRTMCT